jgi:predicted flavoprotein YhiN
VAIGLLREAAHRCRRRSRGAAARRACRLHQRPAAALTGIRPIARAISTAGGVRFAELDPHFMLKKMPGVFVAGEMIDWEAPTGGYLLQASFATGAAAARGALHYLGERT